ncbi:hypothetical protein QFC19_001267 [Naganishia cerealis]|uniref:Uncharacterized protein n=1 Tax=Naganishia cerealis TaxID=610337 RepID=A0ACC2WGZ6_9TREE|nr:hypothetical protein QFC19_001267 [Naganishia cerealis]
MVYSTKPAAAENAEKKLTERELREWNHMAEGMEYYHNHFRHSFDSIYQVSRVYVLHSLERDTDMKYLLQMADGKFHSRGLSLQQYLKQASSLYSHLEMHHQIEEKHIFPILARKMPQFKAGARESGAHLKSHKQIHNGSLGMDKYAALLTKYAADPTSYSPTELRENMDSWREVLFHHLEEEVHDLSGDSMRKAGWTLNEVKGMPM